MKKLTIVQMNDSHAYLDLHPELFWEQGRAVYRPAGGYARVAALLRQIRAENPESTLFLDGGDTFHGTYAAVQTRGQALAPVLNALAPQGMTAHWEFAYTPAGFRALADQLNYPVLAMNVYEKSSGKRYFPPYQVVEVGGLRVGVAGIASNIVDKTMPPEFSAGLQFTDGREELPGIIQALREQEKADVVVLVSHLGYPQDMWLLEQVQGVDVALSAHTHHRLEKAVKQGTALVVQAGSHGSFLTRLDLSVEDRRVVDARHALIEVAQEIEPDPAVESLVQAALRPYREELAQVVGHTRRPLDRGLNLESTMDNLLLEALLQHTGADMAFSNGWRYGAPVPPGPVTLNDLHNIVPVNPAVMTVDLRGEELRTMLEENLEHTFSRQPLQQMGGYVKRALGIRVLFKMENPPLGRIQALFAGEQPVRPGQVYRAAFITEQGVPECYGNRRQQHPVRMVDVLRAYLAKAGPLEVGLQGTFTLV